MSAVSRQRGIDREEVRAAIRRLGNEYVYYMLDEAIDLLSKAKLERLVGRYLDLEQLRPERKRKGNLLAYVKAFEKASLSGSYYESFDVNSRNFLEMSKGTRAWIAECNRLLDRCVIEAKSEDSKVIVQAFEAIFGLLRHIDECLEDAIFFADEAGSGQVGVNWSEVLPAFFRCLAQITEPEDW